MTGRNKINFISLKGFLFLIVVAAFLAISPASMAAGPGGPTPDSAVPLAEDVNLGHLDPGEQHWYNFSLDMDGQLIDVEQALTMIFTPDKANIIQFVSLKIFGEDQPQFFFQGDASKMTHLGAGSVIVRDDNPETGELFWTGWVSSQKTYFIQVLNDSDFPIDYRLFSADISSPPPLLGEPEAPAAEPEASVEPESSVAEPAATIPAPFIIAEAGPDPANPAPLPSGAFQSKLDPKSIDWYTFQYPGFTREDKIQELDFSLFFTPSDGNRQHYVNFELFAASEVDFWRRGDGHEMTNFGAGMLVSRDGDHLTGERIWRGAVLKNNTYLLAVENGTDIEIDYWVFDDDIYNPLLGPQPVPAPPPVFAEGAAPQTALPLKLGVNKGFLEPGEEDWFSFSITDFDEEDFEEMALTLITTPDDGNRIRYLTFDVFTAGGARNWSPGDNTRIDNFGAGSVVYRDDNPLTGERFWSGWVVDNDLYLVQIRNGTGVRMDYSLFTGDVYRPELGEKTKPTSRIFAAGTAPSAPEPLAVGVNRGRLKPNEEQWYVFSRGDVDQTGSVETVFTMVFTPDDGNRIRKVNFELFEGNQLRDWAPDNRFNLVNFGAGSVVNRDGGLETGELLWRGHVQAGDLYYIRASNESDKTIDYWIFPEDVINTSLERR